MFSQSSMFLLKIVAEMPKLNGTRFCSSCMRRDGLVRLVEAVLHLAHFVVHLADAVDRHAVAEDDALLVAQPRRPW